MSDAGDIGNRHLLAVEGLDDAENLRPLSISVIVDDDWAATVPGQLLAISLVNLLCRQARVVSHVEINAPDVPLLVPLPCGPSKSKLRGALEELGKWAIEASVVTTQPSNTSGDFTIFVGPKKSTLASLGCELVCIGDGWRAWVGEPQYAPKGYMPHSKNPLGPFLAASVVTGEIFKRSRGIRRGKYISNLGVSLWSGQSGIDWSALEDGPTLDEQKLPSIHLIGAGAVGKDVAYILGSAGLGEAYLALVDDDQYDGTNLNRCLLAGWDDITHPKVDAVKRFLLSANVGVFSVPLTVKGYAVAPNVGLREDVAARVRDLKFDIVLSCVDKGGSRQDIQGLWPKLLLGGSTLGLQAKTNAYRLRPDAPCLACHNPAEQDGAKIRELEQTLRNMPVEERRQYLLDRNLPVQAIEDYFADPDCGTLGEAALRDFATQSPNQFSVGFVSLGAAVLLVAALFRYTLFATASVRSVDMTTFNFLNGGFGDAPLAADDACQLHCSKKVAA